MSVDAQLGYLTYGAPTRNPFNYAKTEQINRDIATPWLTLEEITNQLNLFGDDSQNTYLSSLELAVRMAIEDFLGLSITSTSYRVWYNAASLYGTPLTLDLPAVSQNQDPELSGVTVDAVKYWDDNNPPELHTLAVDQYYYDNSGNKIVLANLPTNLNSSMTSPVYCEYTTAPNPIGNYPVVKQAGLLLFTHLYNNRSETTGPIQHNIPWGVQVLLRPYKPLVM